LWAQPTEKRDGGSHRRLFQIARCRKERKVWAEASIASTTEKSITAKSVVVNRYAVMAEESGLVESVVGAKFANMTE
jgi:hypothetical protein